jgi:hypothetical protein
MATAKANGNPEQDPRGGRHDRMWRALGRLAAFGLALAAAFALGTNWFDTYKSRWAFDVGVLIALLAILAALLIALWRWRRVIAPAEALVLLTAVVILGYSLIPPSPPQPTLEPSPIAVSTETPGVSPTAISSLTPNATVCSLMTLAVASVSNHVYYMYNDYGAATYYDDLPYGTTFVVSTTFVPSNKGDLVRITSGSVKGFSYAGKYVLVADIQYWGGRDWQSLCR